MAAAAAVAVAGAGADPAPRIGPRMASSPPPTPPVIRLIDMEKKAIMQALEKTHYNRTAAAKLLGITFRALRYKMVKLGINDALESND